MNNKNQYGILQPADLEQIEHVVYRKGDDLAMAITRSFERLEERLDAIESRLFLRMEGIEKELGAEFFAASSPIKNKSEEVAA